MNLKHVITSIIAAACSLAATAQNDYQIKVDEFNQLIIADAINVVYTPSTDGTSMVTFNAPDNLASLFLAETKKQKLILRLSEQGLNARNLPTLHVTSPTLERIQNNGDSTVHAYGLPHVAKFSLRLEGNGTLNVDGIDATEVNVKKFTGRGVINAQGRCEQVSVSNTGTGAVNCAALDARDAKCKNFGTGSISVYCTGTLSVMGASGTVYYAGNPVQIKQSLSVGLKLRPIEQQPAE